MKRLAVLALIAVVIGIVVGVLKVIRGDPPPQPPRGRVPRIFPRPRRKKLLRKLWFRNPRIMPDTPPRRRR